MLEYYLKKYDVSKFFFGRYFDKEKNIYVDSFIFMDKKDGCIDLWNKKRLHNVSFIYAKDLTEYDLYFYSLSLYKAQKIAKKYKRQYIEHVEYQEDIANKDPNRLKQNLHVDESKKDSRIFLNTDSYEEIN